MAGAGSPSPAYLANKWQKPQIFDSTVTVQGTSTLNGPSTFNGAPSFNSAAAFGALATFNGGISYPGAPFNELTNDYTNSSLSDDLSTGLGVSLVSNSNRILIQGQTQVTNSSAADGFILSLFRSTVGTPAPGSAPADTDLFTWEYFASKQIGAGTLMSVSVFYVSPFGTDVPLVAGTTYSFYLTIRAFTGGNATIRGNGQSNLFAMCV